VTQRTAAGLLGSQLFSEPVRFVARILACVLVVLLLPFLGGNMLGRPGAFAGIALGVLAVLWLWLWLPRAAHAAFDAGTYAAAQRRYRLLGVLAATAARERAALLSRAGCFIASGELTVAERLLASLDGAQLAVAERAVWLNNRACVVLAAGRDAHGALALVDEASALRPDVPALQHTRGMALLAVGRVDDAIAVLDGMRVAGELPARLEAERCRDLATAWAQKGQAAYAEDYRLRAEALVR
jgi:predicted Zn-dependent protease